MHIAVDAMGGDHAPGAIVEGALAALGESGVRLLLVGDLAAVETELSRHGGGSERVEIVEAEEVVGMDEAAVTPIRRKRRSSIRICAELVRDGRAQALVSAGNTGATMACAKMVIGTISGVDRPALAAVVPNRSGRRTVLLDVGANIGSNSSQLREFAVMGHFYAQEILGTAAPRVGLMSYGEEEEKGTDLTREVFRILERTGLNFIGNVEGRAVFDGSADVIVCDGFIGNAILKASESIAELVSSMLREELERTILSRAGYLLARGAFRNLARRTDYAETGGAPLLGVMGVCIVGHG
ncbi:MAG: phosphate acyltransferase PlsX, partial [Thermoanaerobaculia bacterium]|nr:phosphate acyltransferase PlsX [Thermoanaerobaculia bacterium]